jgi:parallel beta-helix repeat protein
MKKIIVSAALSVSLFLMVSSCKKDITDEKTIEQLSKTEKPDEKVGSNMEIVVHKGESIQAAVNAAVSGSVIKIEPGTYKETIEVNKASITIIGQGNKVIIENPGDEENGIKVTENGDGFVLKNVTVKGFEENGVLLTGVDGFLLSNVTAIDNEEYGLFPVHSTNGIIEKCVVTGSSDTGIYVGQSTHVEINQNEAYANVNGIEIENCSYVTADKNHSYNNVDGILVVLLPNLEVTTSANITLTKNHVHDNNHINFANPNEGYEHLVPSGSGILIVGGNNITVADNHVKGNDFVGIAVVSANILNALAGNPAPVNLPQPNPIAVKVISNNVMNNGANQHTGLPLPSVDLLWDYTGNSNCWSKNIFTTSFPSPLPACN